LHVSLATIASEHATQRSSAHPYGDCFGDPARRRNIVKWILLLLSLLGLLLFLATPALGDTRGGPVDVKFNHVEPNTPVQVERIFKSGGKLYAVAATDDLIMIVPNDPIKYQTLDNLDKTRVTRPVDAPVTAQVWNRHGSWTAHANGKTYHGFKSREEAMVKAMTAVMDQIDALEDVPDTGGIAPGVIALAGMVLLIVGHLLLQRIVSS
jgi:hypothetical protein